MGLCLNWITDAIAGQLPSVASDHPAVAFDDQPPISWGELRGRELQAATALRRAGVGRGDRVALVMRNSVEYVVLFLAIARVGAISVRLNWRLTAPELRFTFVDSGATLALLDAESARLIEPVRDAIPVRTFVVMPDAGGDVPSWSIPYAAFVGVAAEEAAAFPELDPEDPATIMYTSGTTGLPKGAVLTHGNELSIGQIQAIKWQFGASTVNLTSGPLYHAGSFECLLMPALISHGTAVTLASGGFTLRRLLEIARIQRASMALIYTFMLYELARLADLEQIVPPTLRRILCGGDTLMPWLYETLERRVPGLEIFQSYSLTEGGAVSTCLDPWEAKGHESSVGRPYPLCEVKVLDPEGRPTATDEVGEVHVRSGGVAHGYWQRPEANAETFVDGWCRTGDLGGVDADGFLSLAGRAKDMIRSGGENIYPAELERVIADHPDVGDVAVVAVPDPRWFEVGCCVLVAEEGRTIDLDSVRGLCEANLARYKIPKHFVVADQLPRNLSGKVLKYRLREQYAEIGDASARAADPADAAR